MARDEIKAIAITPTYRPVNVPGTGTIAVGQEVIVSVVTDALGNYAPGSCVPGLLALVACDPPRATLRIPDPSEVKASAPLRVQALDVASVLRLQLEREAKPAKAELPKAELPKGLASL